MEPTKSVRVLLVDDSPPALEVLRARLGAQPGIEVVGTVSSGFELTGAVENLQPDLVITGIHIPRINGLEVALRLRELMPDTRFIFITDSVGPASRTARAGSTGVSIAENASAEDLLGEIRRLFPGAFAEPSESVSDSGVVIRTK